MKSRKLVAIAAALTALGVAQAADRVDIVSEDSLAKHWRVAPGTMATVAAYPAIVADKSDRVCVGIGYQVHPDGSTSSHAVLRSWSAAHPEGDEHANYIQPFARNAIAAVQAQKLAQVRAKQVRVIYTATTFTFGNESPEVRERCHISNLMAFIAKAQAEAMRRGNLKKSEMDRDRQVQNLPPLKPP